MMGRQSRICKKAYETAFSVPVRKDGSGAPNMCPMPMYIKSTMNTSDTMRRVRISRCAFMRASARCSAAAAPALPVLEEEGASSG